MTSDYSLDKFAVFILSNRRPNKVFTVSTLIRCGFTGKWYILIDDEDPTLPQYEDLYGSEHIIVFNKQSAIDNTDTMTSNNDRASVVFARNVCFDIAKNLHLEYFWELEDDYHRFEYRYEQNGRLMTDLITCLDDILICMIKFLTESEAYTVAFSQGGDLIGGVGSSVFKKKICRKAMNSFLCKVDRPFRFTGIMNDDVNTYITEGSRGKLFFTIAAVSLVQGVTQHNSGGLSELYTSYGTYAKSFLSVVCCPSSICVSDMGPKHSRIHHSIDWEAAVPKIISDKFKVD